MTATVLDSATRADVQAATTQEASISAVSAPWAGGDVTVRCMAGATIAEVGTYGPLTFDELTPRGMALGALSASTVNVSGATITSYVLVDAGTPILSVPAADLTMAAATTQTGRRTNLSSLRVTANPALPLATTYLLTLALDDTGTVGVDAAGSIVNTGTGPCAWSITPPTHVTVTPSSGTLAAGDTQALVIAADAAGTYSLTLECAGATIIGNPQSIVVAAAPATSLTLSMPSTGTEGVAVTVTVTPNGPVAGGGTATLATTAGTLGSTTLTWTAGESAAKTTTLTLAAAGSASVTLTTGTGLTIVGSPASFTASAYVPAWVTSATVGAWAQLSGTTAPTELKDYSGVALRDDETGVTLYSAGAGGHSGNYNNNRVMYLQLNADAPGAWQQLLPASDTTGTNLGTGGAGTGADAVMASDGRPTPRHTYTSIHWCPDLLRVMIGGEAGGQNSEGSFTDHFGLDPDAPSWDARGTWPNRPNYRAFPSCHDPATGKRWAFYSTGSPGQFYEYNPRATPPTWTLRTMSGGTDYASTRGAYCFDPARSQIFHLSGGGWFTQGYGTAGAGTQQAQVINPTTFARTNISFNASAAWTDFQANSDYFVGSHLVYDDTGDCFYFYNGNTGDTNPGAPVVPLTGQGAKVYRIIPNGTSTWDMEIVAVTGVTPADEPNNSGVYAKLHYVSRWRCLVLVVSNQSVYFLKVA